MIRIEKNKLVIEIPCKGMEPLGMLSIYQKALINLFHIANLNPHQHNADMVADCMHFTTEFLQQMTISEDQNAILNNALNNDSMAEFNKWCK